MTPALKALLNANAHRFASCWKIERTDGIVLRFTDHNVNLTVNGEVYASVGMGSTSARQHADGLDHATVDVRGAFTDDAVTHEDMIAGRYREAKVTELVVDWRYPWVGAFIENVYYIDDPKFDGTAWFCPLTGLKGRLRFGVGRLYTKKCWWRLGDVDCTKDLTAFTYTARSVTGVLEVRRSFVGNHTAGVEDHFRFGTVEFTSGDNTGLKRDVEHSYDTGEITFFEELPFDIQVSDQYTIVAGCARDFDTCKTKFNNVTFFGGFPHMPGTDAATSTPETQA